MYSKKTTSNFEQTFSVFDVLRMLASKIVWILLVGILAATAVGIYSKLAIEPTYESYVTMPVFNKTLSGGDGVSTGDITASESLAKTYTLILQSDTMLDLVIDKLTQRSEYADLKLSPQVLLSCMSITALNDTQILKITITTNDPALSKDIANVFADIAPAFLESKFPVGGVKNLDYAKLNNTPVGPNIVKNCIVAFLVGAFLAMLCLIIKMSFDFTVHEPADIEGKSSLPIVGVIPSIASVDEKSDKLWKLALHKTFVLSKK